MTPLVTAVCHNWVIPYVSSGARGAGCFLRGLLCRVMTMVSWPLWFVIPFYAMVKRIVLKIHCKVTRLAFVERECRQNKWDENTHTAVVYSLHADVAWQ